MTSSSRVSPIMTKVGGEQVNSSTKAKTRIIAETLVSCSVFSLYSFITSAEEESYWQLEMEMERNSPRNIL